MNLPSADEFLSRLLVVAWIRKRVEAADYRRVFADMCPTLSPPQARAKLAGWLSLLADDDDITLPKGKRLYDRSDSGDLPAWIELTRANEERETLPIEPETFPWAPELRFACTIRDARHLHVLLCVQKFLAEGGRTRPMVPIKERSVELFGKEKRLEILKNGTLFESGRLTLPLLRCFPVLPPLVWESVPVSKQARPLLILENHSTYHSFAQWNRTAQEFSAVVYGNGDAFKSSAAGLADVVKSLAWDRRVFYFGDMDPEGLLIPLAASATLSTVEMPPLIVHQGCYRRLLERAAKLSLPSGAKLGIPEQSQVWLGPELTGAVASFFEKGIRLPQELVGWEELSRAAPSFARV